MSQAPTKITIALTAAGIAGGLLRARPVFAQLALTVNEGLSYGTIVGWGTQDLRTTIMMIINTLLGFLGVIAVLIILGGGFKWMVSGGNEEKVAEARRMIISGIIGLAVMFMAFAIASFVVQSLANATS
ncbi:MAG: hypothetical protein G01um101431_263 [Parcubacteria group bacterium Gr01-1014_31]|nr:MAG: hypothetical protein G01um101431_263 [Parcubacteria group bacterium Gr01-1014_31]